MIVGIVGLGLIGGSIAKAYSENDEHKCLAWNRSRETLEKAISDKCVDDELTEKNIGECDIIFVALYPEATIEYLRKMGPYIGKKPLVIDCCGIKGLVCSECYKLSKEFGFTFLGGHPMAGRHFSGYDYSTKNLYQGASMVLVPEDLSDTALLERAKKLLEPLKFGKYTVCDAKRHDAMIAFTSQMAHVVSNAYVKSPTAKNHDGFSAGSYKDLTRVAWLNETMWTELFLENKEALLFEIDCFIKSMTEYRDAIASEDAERLKALLKDGKDAKAAIDGVN
ncbi:MAG: prephenate dehydrogenase/arogenate dehydrogenase family protein [Lachnospiraceae bacterium]|nr:prephenate dehydrogenase/arogenate dehydrogenase family protein [Lachnospiraceae bacterium]